MISKAGSLVVAGLNDPAAQAAVIALVPSGPPGPPGPAGDPGPPGPAGAAGPSTLWRPAPQFADFTAPGQTRVGDGSSFVYLETSGGDPTGGIFQAPPAQFASQGVLLVVNRTGVNITMTADAGAGNHFSPAGDFVLANGSSVLLVPNSVGWFITLML